MILKNIIKTYTISIAPLIHDAPHKDVNILDNRVHVLGIYKSNSITEHIAVIKNKDDEHNNLSVNFKSKFVSIKNGSLNTDLEENNIDKQVNKNATDIEENVKHPSITLEKL